jgi:hypothetical protein
VPNAGCSLRPRPRTYVLNVTPIRISAGQKPIKDCYIASVAVYFKMIECACEIGVPTVAEAAPHHAANESCIELREKKRAVQMQTFEACRKYVRSALACGGASAALVNIVRPN